ncbi:MAG: fumarylacetoacetate hydrolase family protein [Magnetospirillum sp.]|nr:fumarylacetoacetate hydrolase family protein [Magnetospirillum sp.]
MSGKNNTQQAADLLWAAAHDLAPCAPVRELLAEGGVEAAYAAQDINTQRSLAAGRRLVGRKIGLTSVAVQKQLGVDQPDYGMLFADMAMPDGLDIPLGRLIQPKAEAEVAFVLGRDLDDPQLTVADVVRAVEYALPALEIVDSRVANWDIRILDTIADNASSGLYVLGNQPKRLTDLDLRSCGMVMEMRGEPVSTGAGAACLGHPLNATLWLAQVMAKVGRPLKAGDTVLSGALGPMVPVKPGDAVEARISGLGTVRALFAKE